jgi:hypothetical protein
MEASFLLRVYSVLDNCVVSFDALRIHGSLDERRLGSREIFTSGGGI